MKTEQAQQPKKSQAHSNAAWLGVVLGLAGIFLVWRGTNTGEPSTFGFVLILAAAAMLLGSLLHKMFSHKG